MIPYLHVPPLKLGPLTIEPFGIFVALGIIFAARVLTRQARRDGLDPTPLEDYAPWGVGVGIVAGHFLHLFAYHPEELSKGPLQILKVWDGLSSFGGLLGGVLAAVFFFRARKLRFRDYADAFALAVTPGWAIARLGCFAVHDHPGVRTDFFLAVQFPGGARHDLGLYDALYLFALTGLLFALRRVLRGKLLPLLALFYALGRFFFDTLRATDLSYVDARYLGLTPAQYGCFALVAFAVWGLATWKAPPQPAAPPPGAKSAPSNG